MNNIVFHKTLEKAISAFDKLPKYQKLISFLMSYINLLIFVVKRIPLLFCKQKYVSPQFLAQKRLVICLHGLGSSPSQFNGLIKEMEKYDLKDTAIFTPKLLDRGANHLEKMIQPIYQQISGWLEKKGSKELILIGVSNGGRIAKALEAHILNGNHTKLNKVKFISIVGATKGSSTCSFLVDNGFSFLLPSPIALEMPTHSKSVSQLHENWLKTFENSNNSKIEREYLFFCSPHDYHVPNKDSTLMQVPQSKNITCKYSVVLGHGHISITHFLTSKICQIIFKS